MFNFFLDFKSKDEKTKTKTKTNTKKSKYHRQRHKDIRKFSCLMDKGMLMIETIKSCFSILELENPFWKILLKSFLLTQNVCSELGCRVSIYLSVYFPVSIYSSKSQAIGLRGRVFAISLRVRGSIPGRVIPKTQKMVLDAALLNFQ